MQKIVVEIEANDTRCFDDCPMVLNGRCALVPVQGQYSDFGYPMRTQLCLAAEEEYKRLKEKG
jgi:hypothetical protein